MADRAGTPDTKGTSQMSDGLPPISLELTDKGAPYAIVGAAEVTNAQELLDAAPALSDPKWVAAYATILNHIAYGKKYELIVDPEAFKTRYLAEYEAEDPDQQPVPGLIQLHNYGIPEFEEIAPPAYDGDTLTFYVRETYLGIPYKATLGSYFLPTYEPVTLNIDDENDED